MKPAATSVPLAGPFALGSLAAPGGVPFPVPVTPDGRALDLRTALGEQVVTIHTLLESRGEEMPRLRVHAPVEPRQIFQLGLQRTRCVEESA